MEPSVSAFKETWAETGCDQFHGKAGFLSWQRLAWGWQKNISVYAHSKPWGHWLTAVVKNSLRNALFLFPVTPRVLLTNHMLLRTRADVSPMFQTERWWVGWWSTRGCENKKNFLTPAFLPLTHFKLRKSSWYDSRQVFCQHLNTFLFCSAGTMLRLKPLSSSTWWRIGPSRLLHTMNSCSTFSSK